MFPVDYKTKIWTNINYSLFISEVNSGFFYKTAEERDKLVSAERQFIENRVQKLIELKKKVCDGTDKSFVVINQKVSFRERKLWLSYDSQSIS